MESPLKILHRLRQNVQSVTYGSSIYRLMLDQGPMPDRLRLSLPDTWPGDAHQGEILLTGPQELFETMEPTEACYKRRFVTHECLRDLRALGTDNARKKAVSVLKEWMAAQPHWDEENWAPPVLGARLSNWIAFYDFYNSAGDHTFTQELILHAVRQLRHLQHMVQADLTDLDGIYAVKGLIYGGLCLIDREKSLGLGLDLLLRQLEVEVLRDGGHISRNPSLHAEMLRVLIDIRGALTAGQIEIPHELSLAIARMVPVLKFFRHGDGGLALFNGGEKGHALMLDATLTLSEAKGRLLTRLPQMRYERLAAGRSLLIVDTGPPPPRPYDRRSHAGLMGFEFSIGRERLLTNCGAAPEGLEDWASAMAATAAHNSVVVEDTNACGILPDGGIGHRPRAFLSQRYEQEGRQCIDMSHDGYYPLYKVRLQRSLELGVGGEVLKGREIVSGPEGRDYTVRWHLHPDVTASLGQGGGSVLLRTNTGGGWRLRVMGTGGDSLALESSIYCGDGAPRRTLQIRVSGQIRQNPTFVEWELVREKTKKMA